MADELTVLPADPREAGARALLRASHEMMRRLFPPEDIYALDIDALLAPEIRFFAARDGADTLGIGALARCHVYGEVKAMFTAPEARGRGVAGAILGRIEAEARHLRLPCLRLETAEALAGAVRLYKRQGFRRRGRFGDYADNETSVYMEKPLD